MVVLDTSALLYWTLAPEKLSAKAARAIREAAEIVVSSISVWEIGLKVKQAKLELPLSVEAFVSKLRETARVRIDPVTETIWLKNLDLAWEHKDPADRTIVATAGSLHCRLVTSDRRIRSFFPRAVW